MSSLGNHLCFTFFLRNLWRISLENFRSAIPTLFVASSPINQSCQILLIILTCLLSCNILGSWRWWSSSDTGTLFAFPSRISCQGKFCSWNIASIVQQTASCLSRAGSSCVVFFLFFFFWHCCFCLHSSILSEENTLINNEMPWQSLCIKSLTFGNLEPRGGSLKSLDSLLFKDL